MRLRADLTVDLPVVAPGASDALSAVALERLGFRAIYVGSYAVSASMLAVPDIGLIGLAEMTQAVRRIARATSVPVVVDAEAGFGTGPAVAHTVEELEDAGASAVHLEDHIFGKHTGLTVKVMASEEMAIRVRLAVAARSDPALMVIARSDGLNAGESPDTVVDRLRRYEDAGADAVFVAGCTPPVLERMRDRLRTPIVITNSPGYGRAQEAAAGAALVLHYGFSVLVATQALIDAGRELLADITTYTAQPWTEMAAQVDDLTDIVGHLARLHGAHRDDSCHGGDGSAGLGLGQAVEE